VEAAQNSAFYLAPNVRFTRTPDKARLSQRAQLGEPVVEPAAEPAPAAPSRVRYTRTPNHLFKQVWGGQSEAASAADEGLPEVGAEHESQSFIEFDLEAEAEARSGEEYSDPAAADVVEQPFAFISDHAFWELGPDSAAETVELAPSAYWDDGSSFDDDEGMRGYAVDQIEQAVAGPAEVAISGAPFPAAFSFGWPSSYSLNLRFSLGGWTEPAREADRPVGIAAALEPAAPVADQASTQGRGVLIRRRSQPPVPTEPAPLDEEPAVEQVSRAVSTKVRTRSVEMAPVSLPSGEFELPPITFLAEPQRQEGVEISIETLQQNAGLLEGVLEDFNIRGEIVQACPGPVVTLYELEPAPGIKSSRVISLADDIARSMSAISARVAVVQGKNAIGIELPNNKRETVFLRELLASQDFESTKHKLALCLGKTIGGEPVIADLARMPHLLVAGTTGSGKSVAINTMILSILYRLKPEECRLIMVDPKMLELSIYDGIPHLLTPVVTDPKKAVVALKWAVREMEERYKKMSKLSVRNIDGFNTRVQEAKAAGEVITRTVQTGFDKHTGDAIYEEEVMDLEPLPYIVVIVDEMADLMMVAGKEIEGTIQRLAQMARAAGIHVVLATQRPSVDVITGTIKANFPTRISFQVTSKIDSRTILGEMGAEQLLGQGDMLYMAGGGRITRVHGPFVSDAEVEKVVAHLKTQGRPQYLDAVTSEEEEGAGEGEDGAVFDRTGMGAAESDDPYEQAVAVVLRDKKASTSYIQRRLQIGYNRAASIMERMENEGIVGPANHAGKREILVDSVSVSEAED